MRFKETGNVKYLYQCLFCFIGEVYSSDTSTAILEVSKQYEDGAKKYSDRNWQKGINVHCFIDSAGRHYLKFLRGDDDEDHRRAFMWNIIGCIWTMEHHPELIDIEFEFNKKGCNV